MCILQLHLNLDVALGKQEILNIMLKGVVKYFIKLDCVKNNRKYLVKILLRLLIYSMCI